MHLDEPLSEQEFDELDEFLLSDRCIEDGMTMDILHGYLTALVIGPEQIPQAEWLPHVWGPSDSDTPSFKSDQERNRIIGLIVRFMNEIATTMEIAPKEFEPLFCEQEVDGKPLLDAVAWAWGFWEGMNLRSEAWAPLWNSKLAQMARPLYLLGADELEADEEALIADPMQRHKLAIEIEYALPHIYKYWLANRTSAVTTVERDDPKVGRNDSCPCGSGKKYKKCCGKDATATVADEKPED